MPGEHWSVTIKRETEKWGAEFTENWTYQYGHGDVTYEVRVVGPNGEACKTQMDPEDAPNPIRARFRQKFANASEMA